MQEKAEFSTLQSDGGNHAPPGAAVRGAGGEARNNRHPRSRTLEELAPAGSLAPDSCACAPWAVRVGGRV